LTEVRIRKVSKLIREAARSHHSNGGGLNSPRRRASTAASSASTSGAPAAGAGAGSAGAWTSASNPGKTSQPSETGSQQQLDIVDDGRRQQQQQSGGGGMSRRGSGQWCRCYWVGCRRFLSEPTRLARFAATETSSSRVGRRGLKHLQQKNYFQDTQPGKKKKLSDGADSSAASASNASAKSNSRDRRRTLAPEVLASQIEQFRKRSDTIRSDPDAAVAAGVAAAASTSEVPSGPASYSTSDIQFQPVEGELQEFYQSTLSSSNLPYSQLDPRLRLPHPKQRPRHRQVEQQPAAGNNLEVRRGSYLLRTLAARGGGDHSDSVVKVRRHRRLLRDRGRGSCGRTQLSTSAPSSRQPPEQLRLIDLSANCIPDVDSLACIAADIDLQVSLAFLNRLSLANNKLTRLPQGVFQFLSNLAHVELNGNRLIEFPYELITCCRLEYLDVSDNDIVELREERLQWVGAVFTLRELLLSPPVSVPMRFLENLYGLERLMLNGNRIGELEPAPLQLKRLRCLSLASNYIRAVPDEFLGCLTNLEEFDALATKVLPTPETSRKLYHLSTVRLSNNQLGARTRYLCLHLYSSSASTTASISSRRQRTGPPLCSEKSTCRHNRIDSVNLNGGDRCTKALASWSRWASLDLSHNPNLTSLPDEIGNLSKLWEMPLDGLKLSLDAFAYPRSNQGPRYFHQKLNKSVSHYRMKLMLVGFGGRGKTSLLRALMKLKQPERQSPPDRGHRRHAVVCFLSQRAIYLLIYSLQSCSTVEGCDAELRRLKPWLS
uniref:Roc domain-containing protein n=1 Tax=Macrostomum lignano TaxID=282301 RepID=A0A1I8JMV9_9PLAT